YSWATWRRPWRGWMAFWTVAGRGSDWPSRITVWHCEPGNHDSLTVCGRGRDGTRNAHRRWRWHVHHWRIQIVPLHKLHRWLFERCELCGDRYPWGYAPVAHQWEQPRGGWWRVTRRAYHHECSSLVTLRRMREHDEHLIRALVAEIRVRADEDEQQTVERLTHHSSPLEFHLRNRLQTVLGYERDDDYELIKAEETTP